MSNLSLKVGERELFELFSRAGRVTDVKLITDRGSRRSKGMAYVEMGAREGAVAALALAGEAVAGQPVLVQASQAEKNLAWEAGRSSNPALQAAAAGLEGGGGGGAEDGGGGMPAASVEAAVAAAADAAARARAGAAAAADPAALFVGSLPAAVTEGDLREMFEPFGALESVRLEAAEAADTPPPRPGRGGRRRPGRQGLAKFGLPTRPRRRPRRGPSTASPSGPPAWSSGRPPRPPCRPRCCRGGARWPGCPPRRRGRKRKPSWRRAGRWPALPASCIMPPRRPPCPRRRPCPCRHPHPAHPRPGRGRGGQVAGASTWMGGPR